MLGKPLKLTKTQDRVGRKIMLTSWAFQSPMVEGGRWRTPGLPGNLSPSFCVGSRSVDRCHSHSGWAFLPYLALSTNTHRHVRSVLNQSPRCVSVCWGWASRRALIVSEFLMCPLHLISCPGLAWWTCGSLGWGAENSSCTHTDESQKMPPLTIKMQIHAHSLPLSFCWL